MTYRQNIAILIALTLAAGVLGQMLLLSSVPHTYSMRQVPQGISRRLASVQDRVTTAIAVRLSSLRTRT